jgi:SpoVK/Ycf46/Vps4 family AAA+-type ATPase
LRPQGFLIAATNLDHALDAAIWRRFDEVIWFDKPDRQLAERYLRMKFRNVATAFDVATKAAEFAGFSYAEIERVCIQAMKTAVIEKRKEVREKDFNTALLDENRRKAGRSRLNTQS